MSNSHADQAPGQNKTYKIIVNGRPREVSDHKISYLQVVQLAFPGEQPADGVVYTVLYSNPHGRDGTLVEGQETVIKDGTVFNVTKTNRS